VGKLWNGKRPFRYALLVLAAMALSLESVGMVYAFDNSFPDPADTEGNSTIWAYSGETRYVRQTDSALRVWFPGNGGTVNIYNANFCASNSPDYTESEDGSFGSYGNGSDVTRFHFFGSGVDADRYGRKYASGDGNCGDVRTISFSGLTDNQNGYYYVNLNVNYVANANAGYDGGMNGYKITASGGAKIGVRDNNSGRGTTQEQTGGGLNYINYYAPFGTPCNWTSAQTATLQLYDIDNVGGSGAQPAGGPEVRVRIYNITNDTYVDFAGGVGTTWRPNGDNTISQIDFTARPGRKYRLELLDVYKNNTIQYGVPFPQIFRLSCGWDASGQARVDGVAGTINARRSTAHTFNFQVWRSSGSGDPDIRIVERWTSGNSGNVYDQKQDLPFNDNYPFTVPAGAVPGTNYCMDVWYSPSSNDAGSANSNNACVHVIEANVSAILDLTPPESDLVEIGGTVTATARIQNSGTATGNLQYNHQIWYEVGGLTSAADRAFDADDLTLQQTGWTNVDVAPGTTPTVNTYTRSTASPPGTASHVCSRMQITRRAGDTSIVTVADVVRCVRIGKGPSMAVTNGDLRVGGSYGNGDCRVTKPGSIATDPAKLSRFFGVITRGYNGTDPANPHHNYVANGILSPGYIENVVSMKNGVGGGQNTELHFARGPGAADPVNTVMGGGEFYGSFTDINENPFRTHCLTHMFDSTRYPSTQSTVQVASTSTLELPAPNAGITSVTYNICSNGVADKLLSLNGPGGGDLVLGQGQQYVVRVTQSGTNCNSHPVFVKINNNVRFTGTAPSIDKLPQFVFLADGPRISVQVDNAVTRLDGIYANRGTDDNASVFLTCAARAQSPTSRTTFRVITTGECSNQLRVNGAVIVGGRIDPYRAAGHQVSGNTDPAEIFNLRGDIVLSDFMRGRTANQLEVINQREVAPRF
jgi:hypothetical protein